MNERKLTKAELDKREDIIKDMKGNKRSLVKRYGKDAEKVMYGRATNMAKKKTDENMDQKAKIREMVKSALSTPPQVNEKFSKEYDDDPALKGGQKDLPDALQKSIIDKSVKEEGKKAQHKDYSADYADIAQFKGKKGSEEELAKAGKEIVDKEFGGDVVKAYDATVKEEETVTEDIDLGHEDNEPGMLKSDLYRIGKYAMELYQIMDKLDDGQEVDLPHWWQAKVIKAKDALVSAKHFLDFELKEPQIDQVTDMVDAKGQKYAIDEAIEGKPSQDEIDTFFSETQQELHYLASKPVEEWDEYDMSNWKAKLKKKEQGRPQFSEDIKEKIAEMIKGAHSVMGDKSKKKKRPSKKDIKLAKDTQADYEKSKDEEEDYEGLAARSGASLEERDQNDPNQKKISFDRILDLRAQKPELKDEIAQLKIDMEQEAEAEGGEIANRYGAELEKLEAKLAKIDKALDAYDLYESINEGKEISKGKIDMMGSKIFPLIKIGTEFVTDGGNYIITGFGQKSNAFQEYGAEKDGKPCKVKLTAMYGIKLEVTDDPKSAVYRKEERLNSIILESIKETKTSTHTTIAEKLAKQLKEAKAPKTKEELEAAKAKLEADIADAERKIETHAKSLAKIDNAPGGGNWSSSSAEGKKSRKLKDAQGKLRDKIDTYTKKLEKLKN